MTTRTLEERERLAYINGDTELAEALAGQLHAVEAADDELRHERDMTRQELREAEDRANNLDDRVAELEARCADLQELAANAAG